MIEKKLYAERAYRRCSKDTEQLEKNATTYPFSSLAGFLLLYHYKKNNHPLFESFAKKTAVNFSNPYWLQLLLHEDDNSTENNPAITTAELSGLNNENLPEITFSQNFYEEKNENITGEIVQEMKAGSSASFDAAAPGNKVKENIAQKNATETYPENNTDAIINKDANHAEKPVNIELPQINTIKVSEETIAFDPLHTVDYFASQGIHLNEEELTTNDKLGSQMKSFTAWLKSMKKLHPGKLGEQGGTATEKLVQASAEESNLKADVLTEAMAEVLIKQDKRDKAIDMYNKLSLINPAKSAYFAAKIESIKQR